MRSIVGRFLEHTRVFNFHNNGAEDVHLSSADWMDRNFFRRVEICFPVHDPPLKQRVIAEGLRAYLDDNSQAWEMSAEGHYRLAVPPPRGKPYAAQEALIARLVRGRLG